MNHASFYSCCTFRDKRGVGRKGDQAVHLCLNHDAFNLQFKGVACLQKVVVGIVAFSKPYASRDHAQLQGRLLKSH